MYGEFYRCAREAGVYRDPDYLRLTSEEALSRFADPGFLCRVL